MAWRLVLALLLVHTVLVLAQDGTRLPTIVVRKHLPPSYTLKVGAKFRIGCSFEIKYPSNKTGIEPVDPKDFNVFWVKNVQEIINHVPGVRSVERKRELSTILTINHVDVLDSGSYACNAVSLYDKSFNASSETILRVTQPEESVKKSTFDLDQHEDILGSDDDLPTINPSLVGSDDGFCEPYRGSVCADILTGNFTIYSTPDTKQDQIEERLKLIMPVFSKLSPSCSRFAIPSLCLFAFPICNRKTSLPVQVCRSDCKHIQESICTNEYFSTKSLFDSSSKSSTVSHDP